MSQIKICDNCHKPIKIGMPIYFIQHGQLGGGIWGNKNVRKGELDHVCYELILEALEDVKRKAK